MFDFLPKGPEAARWACSYYFAVCGTAYGAIMSRIPGIKLQAGLNEAELGYALLCLGLGGLTAFPLAGLVQSRVGSRMVQIVCGLALLLVFPLVGLPRSLGSLCLAFYCTGMATGAAEVAMGTQGVLVERALNKPRLSSLHAMYSVGGLAGSLSAFLLSGLAPFHHFAVAAGLLLCLFPFAASRLLNDRPGKSGRKEPFRRPPLMVFLLGGLALCSYSSEGSVGDWGALFLNSVKGVDQGTAALAYAAFSVTMATGRLCGDRLRARFGDRGLMRGMAGMATLGMLTVLLSPWTAACLGGYALMGVGLSVIVPIVFSAVGRMKDVSPGAGVTVVSTLGYGGLLLAPPLIGILAHATSLTTALSLVPLLCLCLVWGSGLLRRR